MERDEDVIDLGAASAETLGDYIGFGDEVLNARKPGLSDE